MSKIIPIVSQLAAIAVSFIPGGQLFAPIILSIGSSIFGSIQQKKAAKRAKRIARAARESFLNSLQERSVTQVATDAQQRYVYGRARVGSNIVAVFTSGSIDQYKHIVCEHAAHESDAIEEIYINKKALGPLDSEGFVMSGDYFKGTTANITDSSSNSSFTLTHTPASAIQVIAHGTVGSQNIAESVAFTRVNDDITVTGAPEDPAFVLSVYRVTYQYVTSNSSRVRIQKHLGEPDENADESLLTETPDKWTENSKLSGHTYTVVRLDLREDEFQAGVPDIEVLIRGKKLYDPRTDLTEWSENPALVIYDYLTSEFSGVPASDLPTSHYITAANVCDEVQSFGNLYTCNGTVTSEQDQVDILETLADCMAGSIVATTWEVTAGKYIAPIASLTQSDVVGAFAVTPGLSDADIINGVRGQSITPENLYVPTDYEPFQNPTYRTSDGKDKYASVDYPFTDSKQRAHNLARILVEDQRNGFTVKAEFSLKAWDLRIGDRVTFDSPFLGQAAKVYRITDKTYSPSSSIDLTLKEDVASIWDLADTVTLDDTPNTNFPNPFLIEPLSFITLISGTDTLLFQQDGTVVSRICASWNETIHDVDLIEIEWKRDLDAVWQKTVVTGDELSAYLMPVEDLAWYVVRARAVNQYLNVKSDWAYAELHQVIGKSAPPTDLTNFLIDGSILSWTPINDIDLGGYKFKYHYGTNQDWNSATSLHDGLVTETPFDLIALPFGAVTIMGKAVDTSGNESEIAAVIITNLGDAPVANVVETNSLDPTYPGTLTDSIVSSGDIVANAVDSFYGSDNQSLYGSIVTDSFYKPAAGFKQLVYETNEFVPNFILPGTNLTLTLETEGIDVVTEYRLSGAETFLGNDEDSFYGLDVDSFYESPPQLWQRWPGQIVAELIGYQFRVTIGAGAIQGKIKDMAILVDVPDISEAVADVSSTVAAKAIPYVKSFNAITSIAATLQTNNSGGETVETDKTNLLAPKFNVYDKDHQAVTNAKVDFYLQGY